jgi:aryl-alcohol dehydrogenase-like predicted oxidoreductase
MTLRPVARLALGTVQFGMSYGVSNAGQVPAVEVRAILKAAAGAGIDLLDTAAAYGDAETVVSRAAVELGCPFAIVSKTPPGAETDAVITAARRSAELAGSRGLDAILVHHPADLAGDAGDRLWRALQDLVDQGIVRRVGISASFDDKPAELAARFAPAVMQLPVSLFDQRLVRDGTLIALAARGIEIHARSIFLQGLLFAGADRLAPSIRHIAPELEARRRLIRECGITPVDAAIAFALAQPKVRRIVVGVTSVDELGEMLSSANADMPAIPWSEFAIEDATVLNPSRWTMP